jgi:hypothetical protein
VDELLPPSLNPHRIRDAMHMEMRTAEPVVAETNAFVFDINR